MSAISFAGYNFELPASFTPNFGQTLPSIAQLVGVDGGVFTDGNAPSQVTSGTIPFTFDVWEYNPNDMWEARNRVIMLQFMGLRRLFYMPTGQAEAVWCWAKMTSLQINADESGVTDIHVSCSCVFTVPGAVWYRASTADAPDFYDDPDGTLVNTLIHEIPLSITLGGSDSQRWSNTINNPGTSLHTFNWPNAGTGVSIARLAILRATAGDTSGNVTIQRVAAGIADDYILFRNVDWHHIFIDGHLGYAAINGLEEAGMANVEVGHPQFLRLAPGDNTITLQFSSNPGRVTLYGYWFDAWR